MQSRGVNPLLSIVLPCRNQADHIETLLARYRHVLTAAGEVYELVVVPNACTDRTPEVVRRVAAIDPAVRVIESVGGGWGLAVRLGLAAAQGDVLCYSNSARTDPAHVVELLALYRQHAPCLAKTRRVRRGVLGRALGSWLYNGQARLLFGLKVRDVNGTPKIFSRRLYECLQLTSGGDLLDLELMVQVERLGVPVVELVVDGFRRHGGRSSTGLRSAWRMYTGAWHLWRSRTAEE